MQHEPVGDDDQPSKAAEFSDRPDIDAQRDKRENTQVGKGCPSDPRADFGQTETNSDGNRVGERNRKHSFGLRAISKPVDPGYGNSPA